MVRKRTQVTSRGPATISLGERARLVAVDPSNWALEILVTAKGRSKWKRAGYFSKTSAGLRAAARRGVEDGFRANAGESTVEDYVAAVEEAEKRLGAAVDRLGVVVTPDGIERGEVWDAIRESMDASTRVVDDAGRAGIAVFGSKLVEELRARGLRIVVDVSRTG
jgi:hypothetical protein